MGHHDFPADFPTKAVARLQERIKPLQEKLAKHALYKAVYNIDDLKYFMQNHVYAVWDFMSLLKSLQRSLTCIDIPWSPKGPRDSRRLINEIVLGEESDFVGGKNISHLELYLDSMKDAGADSSDFLKLMESLDTSVPSDTVLHKLFRAAGSPLPAEGFCRATFDFIRSEKVHIITSAFTFGREDLIPLMFTGLLRDMNQGMDGALSTFIMYLERHIEVDGEDHGPMALKMMAEVCGNDEDPRWEEAIVTAEQALQARIDLWDGVVAELDKRRKTVS